MHRIFLAAALGAWAPWPAAAQEGPSFNCADSDTASEAAICASPNLARLELRMAEAYEDLVARIGQREARRIADELLAVRQACGADEACIETRLMISMGVFISEGQPELVDEAEPLVAAAPPPAEPPPVELPPVEPAPTPAAAPAPAPETAPEPEPEPAPEPARATRGALDPQDVLVAAPAPEATPQPQPQPEPESDLGRTFAALPEYRRVNIEGRLQEAGYALAVADGLWGGDTEAAVGAFLDDAADLGVGPGAAEDPAAVLTFIDSDAFKRGFLGEEVPLPFEW